LSNCASRKQFKRTATAQTTTQKGSASSSSLPVFDAGCERECSVFARRRIPGIPGMMRKVKYFETNSRNSGNDEKVKNFATKNHVILQPIHPAVENSRKIRKSWLLIGQHLL